MDIGQEMGVQSYCFRHFKDNATTAAMVKECGLARIEICGVQVDFQDTASFDSAIGTYRDAGVEIVSIGVNGLAGDEAVERNYFEFLQAAGAKFMSVDFKPDAVPGSFALAEELAEEYDVRLAIHNHGGRHWLGSAQALEWVFTQTSPRVGLCLDTAWALHSHEDPIEMIERFGQRLYGVHVKDFTFDSKGQHTDVVVGTGNLDLSRMARAMDAVGFDGYVVLEYEADVENPVPALRGCVEAVRAIG